MMIRKGVLKLSRIKNIILFHKNLHWVNTISYPTILFPMLSDFTLCVAYFLLHREQYLRRS